MRGKRLGGKIAQLLESENENGPGARLRVTISSASMTTPTFQPGSLDSTVDSYFVSSWTSLNV